MLEALERAARIWSEQRIPETRRACLWRDAVVREAEQWLQRHPHAIADTGLERAFLDACMAARRPCGEVLTQEQVCSANVEDVQGGMLSLAGGEATWLMGQPQVLSEEQYARLVGLSWSFVSASLLCLLFCLAY